MGGVPSVACTVCNLPLRWAAQPPCLRRLAGGGWGAPPQRAAGGSPGGGPPSGEGRRVLWCHAPGPLVEATGPAAGPGERHPPAPAGGTVPRGGVRTVFAQKSGVPSDLQPRPRWPKTTNYRCRLPCPCLSDILRNPRLWHQRGRPGTSRKAKKKDRRHDGRRPAIQGTGKQARFHGRCTGLFPRFPRLLSAFSFSFVHVCLPCWRMSPASSCLRPPRLPAADGCPPRARNPSPRARPRPATSITSGRS